MMSGWTMDDGLRDAEAGIGKLVAEVVDIDLSSTDESARGRVQYLV